MPEYTLKNTGGVQWRVNCKWSDLEKILEDPNVSQVLATPKIISGRSGGEAQRVPDGFTDLKKQIKKNSGRGNTIKI